MVYEKCLEDRNATLLAIFGHEDKIPLELPPAGALLNFTNANESLDNLIMPEMPECDLEKELDNVSERDRFYYLCKLIRFRISHGSFNFL